MSGGSPTALHQVLEGAPTRGSAQEPSSGSGHGGRKRTSKGAERGRLAAIAQTGRKDGRQDLDAAGNQLCFARCRQENGCQVICPFNRTHACEWCLGSHRSISNDCPRKPRRWVPPHHRLQRGRDEARVSDKNHSAHRRRQKSCEPGRAHEGAAALPVSELTHHPRARSQALSKRMCAKWTRGDFQIPTQYQCQYTGRFFGGLRKAGSHKRPTLPR